MAFPGFPLPTDRTNATPMTNVHPDDHNDVNAAANDLQGQIDAINANLSGFVTEQDFDAAGDLLVGTGNDTYTNLPVGPNWRVLTANSGAGAGMAWRTPVGELINSTAPSGGTFVFGSIPQTFSHLVIEGAAAHNNASGGAATVRQLGIQFNGDIGSNYQYSTTANRGDGTRFHTAAVGTAAQFGWIGTNRGTLRIVIPLYTVSTGTRQCHAATTAGNGGVDASWRTAESVFLWSSATAITSITVSITAGGGDQFSNANLVSLYGFR